MKRELMRKDNFRMGRKREKQRQPNIFTASNNTRVKNGERTTKCRQPLGPISSWIAYYRKYGTKKNEKKKNILKCAIKGCKKKKKNEIVEGHVTIEGENKGKREKQFWILEICKTHNHHINKKWMVVENSRKLVEVTKDVSDETKCQHEENDDEENDDKGTDNEDTDNESDY